MRLSRISGAVFDCDGILVDSEQPWIDLMADCLRRIGAVDVPAQQLRGLTAAEAVVKLAEIHDGLGAAATSSPPSTEQIDSAYGRALAGLTAPMPGAQELVAAMSGTIPVAVASNGRGEDVRGLLERAGMLHLFDEVVTIDDVADGKPAPDPYLTAVSRLGLDPAAAVAFEDSPVGSQAAHRAGCTVIGVNEDAEVGLTADVRLTHLGQARFDTSTRTLHLP